MFSMCLFFKILFSVRSRFGSSTLIPARGSVHQLRRRLQRLRFQPCLRLRAQCSDALANQQTTLRHTAGKQGKPKQPHSTPRPTNRQEGVSTGQSRGVGCLGFPCFPAVCRYVV